VGLRAAPSIEEIWRSYASLAEREARLAFFRTLRAVVDAGGQTVSATDRLYLASRVPTLIVWGARDSLIPVSHAVAAHEVIPESRLEIFEDAGHFPHCETPERFVEAVVDFIDATEPVALPEVYWREMLRCHSQASSATAAGDDGPASAHPVEEGEAIGARRGWSRAAAGGQSS
jgi:hypothetical protein